MIDHFIGWFLRHKARDYLAFEESGEVPAPRAPSHPVHLYVHIPFCTRLCPYCSFHRVAFSEPLARAYFAALRRELELYAGRGFSVSGVYIGGGTPTILMDELLMTLECIQGLFSPQEISVETNPDRLEPGVLASLAQAGVKRVSVGVQTFDDDLLRLIGRYEKYGSGLAIKERLATARGIVDTLNVDMIFNFPAQHADMLEADLDVLEEIGPDQITFYPLMVSDATRRNMDALMGAPDPRQERHFFRRITRRLERSYESSSAWCFSRKGTRMIDEYIVSADEYVGAGSGAFGLVEGAIYANTFSLDGYVRALGKGELPLQARKLFSRRELARYSFLMELFGLELDRRAFKARFGRDVLSLLGPECLFFWLMDGLRLKGDTLRLTEAGRYYWVIMMREFFIGVDNFRDLSRRAAGIET